MKKILLIMMVLVFGMSLLLSQTIADYTFSTATDGSMIDMSSGTTDIFAVGTYRDDDASSVTNIGFTYNYGTAAYTQFSVNSNGQMQLGSTAISGGNATPSSGLARIAPISGDNALTAVGKVHYKVLGAEPNRILVVEWDQLRIHYGSSSSPPYCTVQALLYENSKRVDFIYGRMYNTYTFAKSLGIYISTSNVAGSVGQLTTITTTPTWNTSLTSVSTTSFPASSDMANLNSTADGSRRVFTFMYTPPAVGVLSVAPNPVAFSGNTYTGFMRTQTVSLSNTGGANMTINSGGITIGGTSYFTIENLPSLPYELIPNASVTFDVKYAPEAVGSHTDVITISDSRATTNINVSGTAVAPSTGEICEAPYVIASLPLVNYAGTTTGFANDYTQAMFAGYTGFYAGGRDWVAKVTVPEWGRLTVSLADAVGSSYQYMGAFLVSTIPSLASPATIIAQASANSGTITFNANVAAGDYYIIVDNWPSPDVINFVMNVSFTAPTAAPNVATLGTPTPTGVVAVAPTATLNWVAPAAGEPVQGYYLYFGTDGGGTVTPTNIVNGTALASNVLTFDPDPDMSLDTTYYWQIVPYNPIGNATSCPIWSFKTVGSPLTGTKTIGVGGDFTTFTGAVSELNGAGIGEGGVTFNVLAGSVFTEEVPAITATGTAANPIVFQKSGEGANPVVRPTTGTQGIRISGGDYFTFDGIDIAVASGQIPNWGYYVTNASATNGAMYNTIKNAKITLNKANTLTKGIYDYPNVTPTNQTGINSYNTYQNLIVENSTQGIYVYGNATYYSLGNVIRNCTIGASTADDMGGASSGYGVNATYQTDLSIYNNQIRNFTTTSTSYSVYGIYLSSSSVNSHIYGNTITNLKAANNNSYVYGIYTSSVAGNLNVYNNRVSNVGTTFTTSTYAQYGMYLTLSTTGTNVANVYNNMVWDIYSGYTGTGSTSYLATGIYLGGGTNGTYNVDYNSVRIAGPTSANSAGIYFASNTAVNKLRNNVIVNNTPNQTGSYFHSCVYFNHATTIGAATSVSNNNVLYIANANNGLVVRGTSTNYANIQAWTTASTQDANSRPTDPQIDAANPLNILTGVPTPVESKGMYLAEILTDIYGTTRNASTPDIGAHEGSFVLESFCEAPTTQPTGLVLIPNPTTIAGSFTAAAADAYLVVGHQSPTLTFTPVDGTYYSAGQIVNTNEVIISASAATSFVASGLTPATQYYSTIFAFNNTGIGAPKYNLVTPLTGTQTTLPAAPLLPGTPFTATAVSPTQIDLLTTANVAGDNIMIARNTINTFGTPLATGYAVNDPIVGGGTVIYMGAAGTFNDTALTGGTLYYYSAWSYITADRATYYAFSTSTRTANATTPQVPATLPFAETFEVWPNNWSVVNGSQTNQWHVGTATAYAGTKSAYISNDNGLTNAYTVSAANFSHLYRDIAFTAGASDYELSFMWKAQGEGATSGTYDYDNLKVFVIDTTVLPVAGTAVDAASQVGAKWYNFSPVVETVVQWVNGKISLPGTLAGTTKRVVFSWKSDSSGGTQPPVAVDNVTLTAFMTPKPTALTASAITVDSALLSWTSAASSFDLEWGSMGFAQGSGTMLNSITNNYTLGSLSVQTGYSYYVRANDGINPSAWAGPYNFYTSFALPYTTGFDATTNPAAGWWTVINSTSTSAVVNVSTTSPNSAPNNIYMYNPSSNQGALVSLVSPVFNAPLNTLYARFYARGTADRNLTVGVVNTLSSAATFTPVATLPLTTTYAPYVVDFTTYAGSDQYISFRLDTTDTVAHFVYIDDVTVSTAPWDELAVTSFTATPLYKFTDTEFTFNFSVKNNGTTSSGKNVTLKMGETTIGTVAVGNLAFGATANLTYDWTPETAGTFTFTAEVPSDQNDTNNLATLANQDIFTLGQLAEGFEGLTFPPARWYKWEADGENAWERTTGSNYDGVAASGLVLNTTNTTSHLATPLLVFAPTRSAMTDRNTRNNNVTFYARSTGTGHQIQCWYGETNDGREYTSLGSPITVTGTYTQYTVPGTASLNGNYHIAFQALPNGSTGVIQIDKVVGPMVYIPSEPPGPAALLSPADLAENINPYTVVLTWDEPGSGGIAEGYNVRISTDPEAYLEEDNDRFVGNGGILDIVTERSYNIFAAGTTLDFNTDYYWQIVPFSGSNELEERAAAATCEPNKFTTLPQMQVAQSTLPIGNIWANTTRTGTIAVQNLGDASISVSVTGPAEFVFAENPFTVNPRETFNLGYTFTAPATLGAYSQVITITHTGYSSKNITATATVQENPTIVSFPFVEGFETGNTNASTTIKNWTQQVGPSYSSYNWTANNIETSYNRTPRTGAWNAYLHYSGQAYLFRPIQLVGGTAYSLEFYARQDGATAANSWVKADLGTEATIAGMTTSIVPQTGIINGDYQRFYGTFTPATSGIYYVGIQGWMNFSPWYISLDDIKIDEVPLTPTFTLTPDVEEWNFGAVQKDLTATKQFTITNTGGGTLTINSVATTGQYYSISVEPNDLTLDMNQSTTFTVQYAPTAAGVDQAGTVTITYGEVTRSTFVIDLSGTCVDPRITSLPYSENFDGVVTPALPLGWSTNVNSTSTYVYVKTTTSVPQSSPNNVGFYNSSDASASLILASPQATVAINDVKLSFWARWSSYSSSIIVGTMSDPANAATFTAFSTIPLTSTNTQYDVNFSSYAGTDQYLAFKSVTPTTYSYIYLDTVELNQILASDLAVTGLAGNTTAFQNTPVTHTVTVRNNGTAAQSDYTVYLKSVETRAILAQQTFAAALEPGSSNPVALEWTPANLGAIQIYGEVALTGDQNAANNVGTTLAVTVYQEGILVESFETGTIPSNWTVLNADGNAQSWGTTTVNPKTGTYAARIGYELSGLLNDDWLITPPLRVTSSTNDVISFWMRSYDASYADPWQVLISTTDTNPASFSMIDSGPGNLGAYVQKSYNLDSYGDAVVYLAIRYIGDFDWSLYVDDFFGPPIYVPVTDLDQPVVTISQDGGNIVLDWPIVPNANSYKIYMSADPEAADWGDPVVVGTNQFTFVPTTNTRMFFKVRASTVAAPPARGMDAFLPAPSNKRK